MLHSAAAVNTQIDVCGRESIKQYCLLTQAVSSVCSGGGGGGLFFNHDMTFAVDWGIDIVNRSVSLIQLHSMKMITLSLSLSLSLSSISNWRQGPKYIFCIKKINPISH